MSIRAVALVACTLTISAAAQSGAAAKPAAEPGQGKYLVNNVGMCGECHTPMDKKGQS